MFDLIEIFNLRKIFDLSIKFVFPDTFLKIKKITLYVLDMNNSHVIN